MFSEYLRQMLAVFNQCPVLPTWLQTWLLSLSHVYLRYLNLIVHR